MQQVTGLHCANRFQVTHVKEGKGAVGMELRGIEPLTS